jgi:hypothetical protein
MRNAVMEGFTSTKYFVDQKVGEENKYFESFVAAYEFAAGDKSRITSNSCYYDFDTEVDYFFN